MKLTTLKPRVAVLKTGIVKPVQATERIRGSAWVAARKRIIRRDGAMCQACAEKDLVTLGTEVDHRIPLAHGGSNDDSNLWLLCHDCHADKSAGEAGERAGGV